MHSTYLDVLIPGLIAVWMWAKYSRRRRSKGLPHPPGPQGLPLVGNVLDMPRSHGWLKAAEWKKTFGDIVFLNVLGRPLIFLNSYEIAVDLMEKRSSIYSSRPDSVMINDLQRWDWLTSNMPYGDRWRKHRAYLHRFLEPSLVVKYLDQQSRDAYRLLGDLLHTPDDFFQHVRNCIGSTIMMTAYGHETKKQNDPYITLAEKGTEMLAEAATPGAFLVEVIPWLKYIPAWFPGAGFQKTAQKGFEISMALRSVPYEDMKKKVLDGTAKPSMLSELIELNMDLSGLISDEDFIANVTAIAYAGGADTSVSTMLTFILAMVLNPEAQRRAQEEIDRVIGDDRLPTFADRPNLPYVEALCKECLRWQPVTPLGGPHALTQDNIYNGFFLPKGTMVIANQWFILHDPEEYPDPEAFKPERFLPFDENGIPKTSSRDPAKIAFGFGRRICPGRHMAMNTIFITAASILATFNIKRAIGKDGKSIEPSIDYVASLISHPAPFECIITPRSPRSEVLIKQVAESDV